MKTAVIMQPTYLPWMGYFDLMDQADVFVLLDSVQFDKRSWQQRNRIKSPNGELMLSVPVLTKGQFTQRICEVKIDASAHFHKEHFKSIKLNYAKAKYFKDYSQSLEEIFNKNHEFLTDMTIAIMSWLKNEFGIKTELVRSSTLNVEDAKTGLLVKICQAIGANQYLSPLKSRDYIGEGEVFAKNKIKLLYHQYNHPQYTQLFGEFVSHLAAIDVLFNEGNKSLSIIRSGRQASLDGSLKEVDSKR